MEARASNEAAAPRSAANPTASDANPTASDAEAATRPRSRPDDAPADADLELVMRLANAFGGQLRPDLLGQEIVCGMLEASGARRSCLLVQDGDAWTVVAVAAADAEPSMIPAGDSALVAELDPDVIDAVARTHATVMHNAGATEAQREGTPSVVCAPLLIGDRLAALAYLEHDGATLTSERVHIVELLAAHAATALDNAHRFAALEASEAQNRRIVSTADEGIVVLGPDGTTITFVNARMAQLLGVPEDELIGRQFTDLMVPTEVDDHWRRIEARRHGIPEHYERRFRRADGTDLWTLASATPITDDAGAFIGSFGMFTDVTERKQAEQELALVRHALDRVGESAFLIDKDGRFRLVNEEACRALALTREELLSRSVWDIDPDQPASTWRQRWELVRDRRSVTFASRHRASDGRTFPVEISASHFEFDGRAHILALVRDMSERQQSEGTIRRLNAELEATIGAIPDLMFEIDRDGTYLAVHAHDAALLAAPAEALIGRRIVDMLPPEAAAVAMRGIREAEERGASHGGEFKLELADGVHWFEQSLARKVTDDEATPRFIAMSRDVTERVAATEALERTAEELRESEERYRLVFDNIRESLYLLEVTEDGHFRYLEVNPALCASTGIDRDAMVGHVVEESMPAEAAAALNAEYAACVAGGQTVEVRRVLDLPSGTRHYDSTLIPVRNAEGRIHRLVGISHDVTDNVVAERARRATEMQYQTLLEQASEAIFVSDAQRQYTEVNIAACEMLGYERDELLRLRVEDVTPPDANPNQEDRFRRMMAGEVVVSERFLRRKDGSLVPVELSTRRLPDGRYVAMGRDISERRRAEAEQARLVAAVEQAAEAIVITDPDAAIRYVNPAFELVTGYSRAELLGQNPRILHSGVHDPDFYRGMWDELRAGRTWHGTIVNRRKDGVLFEDGTSISPIHDAAGELLGYAGVQRDVTREHALEAQLRQAQKMEAVGQLAGGIAHDFNNLITAIRGYAELIRDKLPQAASDEGDLDQIVLAADRAAELTRQLLAYSRRLPLQPTVVAVSEVVERLAPMLRRLVGEHIELVTSAAPDAGRVLVDPSQLEQVIVNLAVNARDAMPSGGRLRIETANILLEQAEVGTGHPDLPAGAYVTLRVADTGTGMSEETRAHAFEPFYTTKEAGKGTGMGLATVYGIVTASGGAIYLYSEPGRGTTFRIYLPRVDGDGSTPLAAAPMGAVPRGTETVLLVEDEPGVRSFARRAIADLGYAVIESVDGEEAAALAAAGTRFDVVVSDVVMPRLGGPALVERLRQSRPDVRVVLMSGFAEDGLGTSDTATGVVFLAKPFSREALGRAVRRALDAPH